MNKAITYLIKADWDLETGPHYGRPTLLGDSITRHYYFTHKNIKTHFLSLVENGQNGDNGYEVGVWYVESEQSEVNKATPPFKVKISGLSVRRFMKTNDDLIGILSDVVNTLPNRIKSD